jgi:hypothetical protein
VLLPGTVLHEEPELVRRMKEHQVLVGPGQAPSIR